MCTQAKVSNSDQYYQISKSIEIQHIQKMLKHDKCTNTTLKTSFFWGNFRLTSTI